MDKVNDVSRPVKPYRAVAGGAPSTSFDRLQKRAFGGEDVAARPGAEDDDWWPKGPLLPGIQELIDDFVEAASRAEGLRLVFLLGGAGNGKSFAARALGRVLGLAANPNDPLAHRIYRTRRGNTRVELLNDATIAPRAEYGERQAVALSADIQGWWQVAAHTPVAAFCCVNRGIVIDELRALVERGEEIGPLPRAILAWLALPSATVAHALGVSPSNASGLSLGERYREERFEFEGCRVHVAALSVDDCSLLEPSTPSRQSRAGTLFREIVERCREDAAARPDDCPIRANVMHWLSTRAVVTWEEALACSEIASGHLHSYRDIWGLAALSILGPRFTAELGSGSLLDHVDRCLELARRAASPAEHLDPLLELSRFRLHNALFRSPTPTGRSARPTYPPTTPAHSGLSLVDPSAWGSADSPSVESAMQGIALCEHPSQTLLERGLLAGVWSPFDQALERAIVAFVGHESCPDVVRRRLVSWLAGYLLRLVGVATGRFGNPLVVAAWRQCHNLCANGPASLPVELGRAIRSLVFPPHEGAPPHSILVPTFAVRVEPLLASRDGLGPKLAEVISHSAIGIRARRSGGRLLLECTLAGTARIVGLLALDFPLLREALACRSDRAGQTESSAFIEPRIQRCRASSLEALPDSERRLVALSGDLRVELGQ